MDLCRASLQSYIEMWNSELRWWALEVNFTWVWKLERLCEGYYSEKAGRLADRLDVRTERESDPNFPPATSFRVGAKYSQMRAAIFTFTFQRHKLFCNSLGCEKSSVCIAVRATAQSRLSRSWNFPKLPWKHLQALAHPTRPQRPDVELKIFPREAKLCALPHYQEASPASLRNSVCVVASLRGWLPVWSPERVAQGFFRQNRGGFRAALWHRSCSCLQRCCGLPSSSACTPGASVACPQDILTTRPVQKDSSRTGDCRSWLELAEQLFWHRVNFPVNVKGEGESKWFTNSNTFPEYFWSRKKKIKKIQRWGKRVGC